MPTRKKKACCSGGRKTATDCCGHATKKTCICTLTRTPGKFDIEKIRPLVDKPKYICACCGRMANRKIHVCTPVPIHP
jgi:hypothetical protein